MTTAIQMPVREEPARQVGPKLFRKQVLRVGEIEHDGRRLQFSKPYLESLVAAFNGRAYDQVPFVLADSKNLHNEDPERFRGEVKALELTDGGLDAMVELSDRGTDLIRENPRLGVSARIVEGLKQSDGRSFPRAIRHICGTLDPVVTDLEGWAPVSVRSLSQSSGVEDVLDLTHARYMAPTTFTNEHLTRLNELPEDQRQQVEALLAGTAAPPEPRRSEPEPRPSWVRRLFGGRVDDSVSDEDLNAEFEALLGDADENENENDRTTVGATLTSDERNALDLATSTASAAQTQVVDLTRQLHERDWQIERTAFEQAGVPPALLDLAAPVMQSAPAQIDLANGEEADPRDLMRRMLNEAKGTIDLATHGSAEDQTQIEQDREAAKRWKENPA